MRLLAAHRFLSEKGSRLSSGTRVSARADGMAAFKRDAPGGRTAVVVGSDRRVLDEYVTSSGTRANCAGGPTPWGTRLTCEESLDDGHGFVFEVMPSDPENDLSRQPIREMGFFRHEAAGVDASTGVVYLTEDNHGIDDLPDAPRDEDEAYGAFLYRSSRTTRASVPGRSRPEGRSR